MRWLKNISIRDLITEDESAETIVSVADGLYKRLSGHGAPLDFVMLAKEKAFIETKVALVVLNEGLEEIYDWADENSVWLE